jgi:hypothetical protein
VSIYATITGGEEMVHTLHCQENTGDGVAVMPTLQQQADFVRTQWTDKMMQLNTPGWAGYCSTTTSYWRVAVYKVAPSGVVEDLAEALFTPPKVGTSNGLLPPNIALVASLRTGRPGASYRGRLYLGGMSSVVLNAGDGRVLAAARLAAATRLADFLTTINGQDTPLNGVPKLKYGVYSRKLGTIRPITQVSVDNVFDVQRRRIEGLVGVRDTMPVENR